MYDYGCVMAFVSVPNWNEVVAEIDEEDVYYDESDESYGKETEPHITILYGLHDTIPDNHIHQVARRIKPINDIKIVGISSFESDDYDVLKFDIESKYLVKLNNVFKKFPYTTNFPKYHPHLTIAYLKKGMADKYQYLFNSVDTVVNCGSVVYSKNNGEKHFFML